MEVGMGRPQGTERGSSQPKQVHEAEQREGTLKGRLGLQPVAP